LHQSLLIRILTESNLFIQPFPPSGSGIADMDPRQNFNSFNFVRQDIRANAQVNFNNTDNGAAM